MSVINFKYVSPTYKNCAPSAAQQQALASDQSWQGTLRSSYGTEFGQDTAMYNSLNGQLSAIAASTSAYSAPVLASMNAQTLNTAAANAAKVNAALGREAAKGSVTPGVESGIVQAEKAGAETQIMGTMANEQAGITQENANLGIQERDKALTAQANLGKDVYANANQAAGEETTAEQATSAQANTNAQESRSWIGVVGGLANAAVGGLTKGLTGGKLGGGGTSANNYSTANEVGSWTGSNPEAGMSDVSGGAFGEGEFSPWGVPTGSP
jgi:hypothetical protein